ncbi:MAG: DNA-processing protein DprA [Bacteroidota bacterium]|nr:MAG: DNA-processing protein DprA [Bacteroidota bacterium]
MRNKEYSWYMLSNAPGFGAKSINYIYENLQVNSLSINDLFDLGSDELQRFFPEIGRGKLSRANFSCFPTLENDDRLYSDFEKLKSDGVTIIGLDDDRYPKSVLSNMRDNAPPILYCKGYLPLLNQKGVSIVGARDVESLKLRLQKHCSKISRTQYKCNIGICQRS